MLSYIIVYSIMFWLFTSWLRLPRKTTQELIDEIDTILEREKDLLPKPAYTDCEPLDSSDLASDVLLSQLQGMTVKQLKAYAHAHQLTGYSRLRRSELITFITSA